MAQELNAQLTVLAGCGHCPNEENPRLTAEALAAFWSKVT
jgi:pimeloyl-ACP methyl ester carboxylesterase